MENTAKIMTLSEMQSADMARSENKTNAVKYAITVAIDGFVAMLGLLVAMACGIVTLCKKMHLGLQIGLYFSALVCGNLFFIEWSVNWDMFFPAVIFSLYMLNMIVLCVASMYENLCETAWSFFALYSDKNDLSKKQIGWKAIILPFIPTETRQSVINCRYEKMIAARQ